MTEKEKYDGIYSSTAEYNGYGHANHGKDYLPILITNKVSSLIDVGCGHNEFCIKLRKLGVNAIGVDFACKSADLIADAKSLPFENKRFDFLTAFDMLEHLQPDDVSIVLNEFRRVSHNFVFSICYRESFNKWRGYTLHPTVKPESWWIEQIINHNGYDVSKHNQYIVGKWN